MSKKLLLNYQYIATKEHVENVHKLISENYINFAYPHPKTIEQIKTWPENNLDSPTFVVYMDTEDNKKVFVGFIYISIYHHSTEIGYMVVEKYRRIGIASEMIHYAENFVKKHTGQIYIKAYVYNSEASSKLLEKNNYIYCGEEMCSNKIFVDGESIILNKKIYHKELK